MMIKTSELSDKDLDIINKYYIEHKHVNEDYTGNSLDFAADYLEKCECCGEIYFYDTLVSYEGEYICGSCYVVKSEDNGEYEQDEHDIYVDRMMEDELR